MKTFAAYADGFELYPPTGAASESLAPLIGKLGKVAFELKVKSAVNQGQLESDFDERLAESFLGAGCSTAPAGFVSGIRKLGIRQQLDFAFAWDGKTVAVEVEKANCEKILRDLLKCHQYLAAGADFAVIVLPRNYPHRHGVLDLFSFGKERLDECVKFGFGQPALLGRMALLGFTQHCATRGVAFTQAMRAEMRSETEAFFRQKPSPR